MYVNLKRLTNRNIFVRKAMNILSYSLLNLIIFFVLKNIIGIGVALIPRHCPCSCRSCVSILYNIS